MSLLREMADAADRGVAVASATVVDTSRSVPRRAGAKMLVYRDGSIAGTVGGGEMEARVVAEAVDALGDGRCRLLSYRLLDPGRGDPGVCGGDVRIFVEPHMPKPTVIVMGYGHVGRAVAQLAQWLGFRVVAADDRPQPDPPHKLPEPAGPALSGQQSGDGSARSAPAEGEPAEAGVVVPAAGGVGVPMGGGVVVPAAGGVGVPMGGGVVVPAAGGVDTPSGWVGDGVVDELVVGTVYDLLEGRTLDADVSVVLVTRNVDVDAAALPALLSTGAGYVGVMGSERRWATTRARLQAAGVDPEALDRVHAPIGIEVGAETPEEIALSIMAEVIAHRRA